MPSVLRKLLSFRNLLNRRKPDPDEIVEEKWVADFSRQKNVRFNIKSESSYDTSIRKNLLYSGDEPRLSRTLASFVPVGGAGYSLVLSLKKTGCIAWVEAPERRYRDLVISGSIRLDARGGYGAGGVLFRMVDSGTYYSLLISNKGYFRLDVVRNGMPFPLVGWTELPLSRGAVLSPDQSVDFSVIVYGSHLVILLRGRWAAEVNDSSVLEGTICFTAASYEAGDPAYKVIREVKDEKESAYTTEIFLETLAVESRIVEVAAVYEKWQNSSDIDSRARVNLAETFTAMDQYNAAMVQLRKAWDTPGHKKSQRELLLAGRLAQQLGLMADAENYTSQCFASDVGTPEGVQAVTEMAKILYTGERYKELKEYCSEAVKIKKDDPVLLTFQGHAFWNLNEYKEAAAAYDRAFELDPQNGILAKNAANVYNAMGREKEALKRYLEAGRVFLNTDNYNDLGLLVPVLLSLGKNNREAHILAGKWAFAVEDWNMAQAEFERAEKLRKAKRSKPPKDGAQVFLEALLLVRSGKRREAIPLFEEAVSLEKDFALFHFRLAENLFLLDDNPDDPGMLKEMHAALALVEKRPAAGEASAPGDNQAQAGWINNFAAQVALRKGNLDGAAKHLEKAAKVLGDLPAVRVNRGVLFYLRGSMDKALEVLDGGKQDDPEGVMANCAGNLLVRAGRFEEADAQYRKALAAGPGNVEYLRNRAACLMELGLYGEADELLARAHTIAPSPAILEMISYVATKKGEYPRAEQACRTALEMDPSHVPSLLSLGWVLLRTGRSAEAREIVRQLDKLELGGDQAKGREELRTALDDLFYQTIGCASCSRKWKTPKDPPPVPAIRLVAMPPDDLPAGSCLGCGKTYCIGCAKEHLDPSGRFICPTCNRPLKLLNEGLKKIIRDWASADSTGKKEKPPQTMPSQTKAEKRSRGRPPKTEPPSEKRGRGRPRKTEQKVTGQKTENAATAPVKRGPGRPPKTEDKTEPAANLVPVKRKRGRPRK